jgi:hypothetical protein
MPTVPRSGPYRFFFYAGDGDEPPHIHVERNDNQAKFWLQPVRLYCSSGFRPKEVNGIRAIIEEHREEFLESWHEFFGR